MAARSARRGSLAALALAIGLAVLSATTADAADAAARPDVSFTTTGEHAFTIPAGVTAITVFMRGGGAEQPGGGSTPLRATAAGSLAVTPGETLFAEVGGDGSSRRGRFVKGAGGFNGGGSGGAGEGGDNQAVYNGASGGGGASDVRLCASTPTTCLRATSSLASRLLVAGGEGGEGGGGRLRSAEGGPAGHPDGQDGRVNAFAGGRPGGGLGATQQAGGAGGDSGPGSLAGAAGSFGQGGDGGDEVHADGRLGGGGGGGGWYGGGGGSGAADAGGTYDATLPNGGGGGGSSYAATAIVNASFDLDFNQSDPAQVDITYLDQLPAAAVPEMGLPVLGLLVAASAATLVVRRRRTVRSV